MCAQAEIGCCIPAVTFTFSHLRLGGGVCRGGGGQERRGAGTGQVGGRVGGETLAVTMGRRGDRWRAVGESGELGREECVSWGDWGQEWEERLRLARSWEVRLRLRGTSSIPPQGKKAK